MTHPLSKQFCPSYRDTYYTRTMEPPLDAKRQVRILGSIVQPAAGLLFRGNADDLHCAP